jgi:hypothetical protein
MEEKLNNNIFGWSFDHLVQPSYEKYPEGCELVKFNSTSTIFSVLTNTVLKSRAIQQHNTKETFYAFKFPAEGDSNSSAIEFYVEASNGKLTNELRIRVNNSEFEHVRFSNPLIEAQRISLKNSLL